jgi:cytochrome c1
MGDSMSANSVVGRKIIDRVINRHSRGQAVQAERILTIKSATCGVAPDLTHLALRQGIAANALANNKANLAAWVTHAQSLKPEVAMPNVTQFSGEELQAIVAYLQQLR